MKEAAPIELRVAGWGSYLPPGVLTNPEIAARIQAAHPKEYAEQPTDDAWIRERTGIIERRIADPNAEDPLANMIAKAGHEAMEKHYIDPKSIGLLVVATTTPDYAVPATSQRVQGLLGLENAFSYDINAACSGFINGIIQAEALMVTMGIKKAMVAGGDRLSELTDYSDRDTAFLFSDGTGVIVLEQSKDGGCITGRSLKSSDGKEFLYAPHLTATEKGGMVIVRRGPIKMNGKKVFNEGVRYMENTTNEVLDQAKMSPDDVDVYVPHQANQRMIDLVVTRTTIPRDRLVIAIDYMGNCSSGTVPVAFNQYLDSHTAEPGANIVFTAAGAGFTGGAVSLRVGENGIG